MTSKSQRTSTTRTATSAPSSEQVDKAIKALGSYSVIDNDGFRLVGAREWLQENGFTRREAQDMVRHLRSDKQLEVRLGRIGGYKLVGKVSSTGRSKPPAAKTTRKTTSKGQAPDLNNLGATNSEPDSVKTLFGEVDDLLDQFTEASALQVRVEELQGSLDSALERVCAAEGSTERLKEEVSLLQARIAELESELGALREQLNGYQSEAATLLARLRSRIQSAA